MYIYIYIYIHTSTGESSVLSSKPETLRKIPKMLYVVKYLLNGNETKMIL